MLQEVERFRSCVGSVFVAGLMLVVASASADVVVDRVAERGAALRAGLVQGDILVTRQSPSLDGPHHSGSLESPFDVLRLEHEISPFGPILFEVLRGGSVIKVMVQPCSWGLRTRPILDSEKLKRLIELQDLTAASSSEDIVDSWIEFAETYTDPDPELARWILYRGGHIFAENQRLDVAASLFGASLSGAEGWTSAHIRIQLSRTLADLSRLDEAEDVLLEILANLGENEVFAAVEGRSLLSRVAMDRGDYERAEGFVIEAENSAAAATSESAALARALIIHARLANMMSDLDEAENCINRALSLLESLHIDDLLLATALRNSGSLARKRGNLELAEIRYQRSLAITEAMAPGSLNQARNFNNLGNVMWMRGDLPQAQALHEKALAIRQRLSPGSVESAASYYNLALIIKNRGDCGGAESFLWQAYEIDNRLSPDSRTVAMDLNLLGNFALIRNEYDLAERRYRHSLEIFRRKDMGRLATLPSLAGLGDVALRRNELDEAETYLNEVWEIHQEQTKITRRATRTLAVLGQVALDKGDLVKAEAFFQEREDILMTEPKPDEDEAEAHYDLGRLAMLKDDSKQAEKRLRRAVKVARPLGLSHHVLGRSLAALAGACHANGASDQAVLFYEQALESIEASRKKLGGTDASRVSWGRSTNKIYYTYIRLLLELGRPARAFEILERSRSRALLELISSRDLDFSLDLPLELERRRRLADAAFERSQAAFFEPSTSLEDQEDRLGHLAEARNEREEVRSEIAARSPGLEALRNPEFFDLEKTEMTLGPKTLVLSYLVGEEGGFLFAVGPAGFDLEVQTIDLSRDELHSLIRRFRLAADQGRNQRSTMGSLDRFARELGALLLDPVTQRIDAATSVLIVPDGPLHLLPFAALNTTKEDGTNSFLVERVASSSCASITLCAELVANAPANTSGRVLAFGDPEPPSGAGFGALPSSRLEIEAIEALYGRSSATWTGEEASESRLKKVDQPYDILHLACHGEVNERFPLESALILASGDGENGRLEAWEIFETIRMDADLVVLSGCSTGIGKEVRGEGVLGLNRAFHYAGARAVLASLWNVADESTADLMSRFYAELAAGTAKNEALRAAQLELINTAPRTGDRYEGNGTKRCGGEMDCSQPFYWAAFRLSGDWR